MALTSAEVDICNQALARFGEMSLDFTKTTGTGDSGMMGNIEMKKVTSAC